MQATAEKTRLVFITGPESSGKSSLAAALGQALSCPWVPEHARTYLADLSRPYQQADIPLLGRQQWSIQRAERAATSAPFLICDTGFLVLKVWMEYRYQQVDPWIEEQFVQTAAHRYLLCKPDIPWEPDPLREHPQQREALFALYQETLEAYAKPYTIISGPSFTYRLATAVAALQ